LAVKDEYTFDFLELGEKHGERELERALIAFVMRNLHKLQAGCGVNAPGQPEIPESASSQKGPASFMIWNKTGGTLNRFGKIPTA
jgi:hypothetical protein